MKTIIIFLNILLISLLLYYFLTKTNNIIENLAGCPNDKKNVIYRQSAKSTAQGKRINRLEWHLMMLKPQITQNTLLAKSAGQKTKSATKNIKKKAKKKKKN